MTNPRWPEIGAGIQEAEILCQRQSGRIVVTEPHFICELTASRAKLFAFTLGSNGGVNNVLVRLGDADITSWRDRLSATLGEPTAHIEGGARRWLWTTTTHTVHLRLTPDGVELRLLSLQ